MEVMIRFHLFNPGENKTDIILLAGIRDGHNVTEERKISDLAANRKLDYKSYSQVTIQTSRLETLQSSYVITFREN
jgi:hypothetical protein